MEGPSAPARKVKTGWSTLGRSDSPFWLLSTRHAVGESRRSFEKGSASQRVAILLQVQRNLGPVENDTRVRCPAILLQVRRELGEARDGDLSVDTASGSVFQRDNFGCDGDEAHCGFPFELKEQLVGAFAEQIDALGSGIHGIRREFLKGLVE